jgi:hypothetical protein
MVAKKKTVTRKKSEQESSDSFVWPFGRKNYILLGVSLLVIIIGYICLGYGDDPNNPVSLTVAPIVLVIGYGLIPFAILARDKSHESETEADELELDEAEAEE